MTGTAGSQAYCAVICDMVHSRMVPDRGALQERLLGMVRTVNRFVPREEIVSRFVVTTGDEFQGLLRTPALAYEILLAAEKEAGARFRMGVGLGSIETAIRPQAIGMDGPAFHRARRALDECRKSGRRFAIESDHPAWDKFVTCYVSLLEHLRQSWTERQVEVIRAVEERGSQTAAAQALGVTGSAVSQVLRSAGWSLFLEGRADLNSFLASKEAATVPVRRRKGSVK